jgi:hypothetical protein
MVEKPQPILQSAELTSLHLHLARPSFPRSESNLCTVVVVCLGVTTTSGLADIARVSRRQKFISQRAAGKAKDDWHFVISIMCEINQDTCRHSITTCKQVQILCNCKIAFGKQRGPQESKDFGSYRNDTRLQISLHDNAASVISNINAVKKTIVLIGG